MRRRTVIGAALVAAVLIVATTTVTARATYPGSGVRPAARAGWTSLRLADLNTDFDLPARRFTRELARVATYRPDALLLQETQTRDGVLQRWAHRHHYRLWWPRSEARQESVVLLRGGRFRVRDVDYRLGARATRAVDGTLMDPRWIQTVRTTDRRSGRRLAFSSTHVFPQVFWWPGQETAHGAPDPFRVQPRFGTPTYAAALRHIRAIRRQYGADRSAGYTSIVGADLNSPYGREAHFSGFMTDVFGGRMVSDHAELGPLPTHTDPEGHHPRTIDYVYARDDWRLRFVHQRILRVPSDHNALIVDMAVRIAR